MKQTTDFILLLQIPSNGGCTQKTFHIFCKAGLTLYYQPTRSKAMPAGNFARDKLVSAK